MAKLVLVGDVNLMGVDDARVPFARLGAEMRAAGLVFANLECLLYEPPEGHAVEHEGFFADPEIGVASCHWGLGEEVLDYMTEIARAAVDAGADIVIGHGPHYSLPVEVYRGKPIFYGLGSFSFHTGHGGRRHGDWIGMMAEVEAEPGGIGRARLRFVRHNDRNETGARALAEEGPTRDRPT